MTERQLTRQLSARPSSAKETVRAKEAQAGKKAETEEKTGAPEDGTGEQEKA